MPLHWRGVALSNFDGKNWSNPHGQFLLQREADGAFSVPWFSQGWLQFRTDNGQAAPGTIPHLIHYRVLLEPIGTNIFFLVLGAQGDGGISRAGVDAAERFTISTASVPSVCMKRIRILAKPSAVQLRSRELRFQSLFRAICNCHPRSIPAFRSWRLRIPVRGANDYDRRLRWRAT